MKQHSFHVHLFRCCVIIFMHDKIRYFHLLALGGLSKQIFRKSWEFGPTGLTPPLPVRWDSQKGKKQLCLFCILGYSKHIIFSWKSLIFFGDWWFLGDFWWFFGWDWRTPRHIATKSQHLWAVPRQIEFWSILKKSWDWVTPQPPSLGQIPNFYRKFVSGASLSWTVICVLWVGKETISRMCVQSNISDSILIFCQQIEGHKVELLSVCPE